MKKKYNSTASGCNTGLIKTSTGIFHCKRYEKYPDNCVQILRDVSRTSEWIKDVGFFSKNYFFLLRQR